jgi:hypothetical protein
MTLVVNGDEYTATRKTPITFGPAAYNTTGNLYT